VAVSEFVEQLRLRAHWEIAVRPVVFVENRLQYDQLDGLARKIVVRLRGWPVPYIDDREGFRSGPDWIGQDIHAATVPHHESWRLFTSAQFSHLRVISQEARPRGDPGPAPDRPGIIEVWEILLYLTEVLELAARLALNEASVERFAIDVRLHCGTGRVLVSGVPERILYRDYPSPMEIIEFSESFESEQIIARPRAAAVEVASQVFVRFQFHPGEGELTDYQTKVLGDR
jgi:hypothetical protein